MVVSSSLGQINVTQENTNSISPISASRYQLQVTFLLFLDIFNIQSIFSPFFTTCPNNRHFPSLELVFFHTCGSSHKTTFEFICSCQCERQLQHLHFYQFKLCIRFFVKCLFSCLEHNGFPYKACAKMRVTANDEIVAFNLNHFEIQRFNDQQQVNML